MLRAGVLAFSGVPFGDRGLRKKVDRGARFAWHLCLEKLLSESVGRCLFLGSHTGGTIAMSRGVDRRGPGASRRLRRLAPEVLALEGRALLAAAPTTTATLVGPLGNNGFYTGPVTVNLTATDPDSPSSSLTTQFRVNNGPL